MNYLEQLINQGELSFDQSHQFVSQIMSGQVSELVTAGLLCGLAVKGETASEIGGAAKAMREAAVHMDLGDLTHVVDIVGTGGDGHSLFNVSTASSFVAAAAGAVVAKHGNRGVSSASGSSDFFSEAGIRLDMTPAQIETAVRSLGVGFLYAPTFHPAMKHVAPVRAALKVRSLFNLLGPLSNPAQTPHIVLGVYKQSLVELMSEALMKLGVQKALVVHSKDGLDEFSVASKAYVAEINQDQIKHYQVDPKALGVSHSSLDGLKVQSAQQSVQLIKQAFTPSQTGDTVDKARDTIALNAGAALFASGVALSLEDGVHLAQDTLSTGQALEKLNDLISYSNCLD